MINVNGNYHNRNTDPRPKTNALEKNYAEMVPKADLQRRDGRVWYIPHHGIYHPHNPGTFRVVFDCAATYCGVSLNQVLLQGPNLTSSLLGGLLRFRETPVAVHKTDIDCLRFIWSPDGDISQEPVAYRMLVHLFGAVSSPSFSNVALQRTAIDHKESFSAEVCQAVTKSFYVDDFIISVPSVDEAISVVQDITELCSRGGFRLTKWSNNHGEVLSSIQIEKRAKEVKDF